MLVQVDGNGGAGIKKKLDARGNFTSQSQPNVISTQHSEGSAQPNMQVPNQNRSSLKRKTNNT